ncbi:hypothetical protein UlMin_041913 [Ulmus minor]
MAASSSAVAVHRSPLKFDLSMAASSSAVAVDPSLPKYDVFISFRGETRNSFTSHHYSALRQKQINAYIDEESLEKGDDISRALPKAIEESTISIIIFSEDYASSRWSESVLVQQVVQDVIRKLQSIASISIDDLKGLVGIRRQLCEIESLLCIWGMGGIGKTTLARAVFKYFSNQFEGACFLESVREESQRQGLVKLEKEMFSKLLGEENPDVSNSFINVRLRWTKALLVLDDVDDFEQLERLAGNRDRFGPGSKIILTNPNETYEVQALDQNEASQLFYSKAFEENSDRSGYEEISAEVVSYTGGNPLALQVLGSYLKSLGIKEWESALEKLKRTPHVKIQKVEGL